MPLRDVDDSASHGVPSTLKIAVADSVAWTVNGPGRNRVGTERVTVTVTVEPLTTTVPEWPVAER